MCSYDSPESLLPPIELISLASIAREKGHSVLLLDAIAEKKSGEEVLSFIKDKKPHVIVTIIGFECYEEDVNYIAKIKKENPDSHLIIFGYYATQFPEETLTHSKGDIVILGEPDEIFGNYIEDFDKENTGGICFFKSAVFIRNGESKRLKNLQEIPVPAYDLLPKDAYYEPFVELPYGMIQTMRGCPYQCNYCVTSFGKLTSSLTSEEVIKHIKIWKEIHGVKTIRFIDDTFTLNRKRVVEICEKIISNAIEIKWMCLSRLDNLDQELLKLMAEAGCVRIYMGIESGSESLLNKLDKKMDLTKGLHLIQSTKSFGIEYVGFFLGCLPFETRKEFRESISFAKKSKINFATYNPMTPYPGTILFNKYRNQIDFSIYPYKNEWKDKGLYQTYTKRKRTFYINFYFRLSFIINNRAILKKYIKEVVPKGRKLLRSIIDKKHFALGGIRQPIENK